ncbi:MAG: leucine-rich repeat domain-containing protein [Gaiellales bacterium]
MHVVMQAQRFALVVTLALCALAIGTGTAAASTVACSTSGGITVDDATHAVTSTWNSGGCTGSLDIPTGVTSIGDYVLWNARITHVTIPSTVTSIGSSAFGATDLLQGITVDPANPSFSSDAFGTLFDKQQTLLIQYPLGRSETTYAIPSTVQTLGENSFFMAYNLESMEIPGNVTTMNQGVFRDTHHLARVTFAEPSNLTTIGRDVFYNATGLTDITLPASITSVGQWAFYGATSLVHITIPRNVTALELGAFKNASHLARVEFQSSSAPTAAAEVFLGTASGATAYRTANSTGWGSAPWNGLQLGYYLPAPSAPVATIVDGAARVTVTAASFGPAPDTYTVRAVEDSSLSCTIAAPASACSVTGLAIGTPYTFTVTAATTTPAVQSAASAASNAVTPTAPESHTTASSSAATSADAGVVTAAPTRPKAMRLSSMRTSDVAVITSFMAGASGTVAQEGITTAARRRPRAGGFKACSATKHVEEPGMVTVRCTLTPAAKRALLDHDLRITVTTTFTPTVGAPLASTRAVTLDRIVASAPSVATGIKPSAVTG